MFFISFFKDIFLTYLIAFPNVEVGIRKIDVYSFKTFWKKIVKIEDPEHFSIGLKGASINYLGKILPVFDPPPPSTGKFITYAYLCM